MINKETVEKIAFLARLEVLEEEKEQYQTELSNILEFVEKIQELDLSNVTPTAHILDIQNVVREDNTKDSFEIDEILKNAPKRQDSSIVVPKVI